VTAGRVRTAALQSGTRQVVLGDVPPKTKVCNLCDHIRGGALQRIELDRVHRRAVCPFLKKIRQSPILLRPKVRAFPRARICSGLLPARAVPRNHAQWPAPQRPNKAGRAVADTPGITPTARSRGRRFAMSTHQRLLHHSSSSTSYLSALWAHRARPSRTVADVWASCSSNRLHVLTLSLKCKRGGLFFEHPTCDKGRGVRLAGGLRRGVCGGSVCGPAAWRVQSGAEAAGANRRLVGPAASIEQRESWQALLDAFLRI
jgi:hypothetical protein